MNISGLWDQLVDCICRPPRDMYVMEELAGKVQGRLSIGGQVFKREDVVLENKKRQKLQCSHYRPEHAPAMRPLPIVVYCHCNSGSRRDAEEALYVLLPQGISVFCLDFAGSGRSDGDWVTLGAHEVDDLEAAIAHLRKQYPDSAIALWGRSMGAVTCLLYVHRDPSIAGMVVDSPFARLTELMLELVEEQKVPIPKAFMRVALSMMRRSVKKRAGFSLDSVAPLELVPSEYIPALFGHAEKDTFIPVSHTRRLHAAYAGDKELMTFDGDHNTLRPQSFYSSVLMFLHSALRCSQGNAAPRTLHVHPRPSRQDSMHLPRQPQRRGTPSANPEDFLVAAPARDVPPPWDRAGAVQDTFKQLHSTLSSEARRSAETGQAVPASAAIEAPQASANAQQASQAHGSSDLAAKVLDTSDSEEQMAAAQDGLRGFMPGEDDDYDEDLALVLAMSMQDARNAQRHSLVASAHAQAEAEQPRRQLHDLVPDAMQRMNSEDADEMMLVEAIKASLQESKAAEGSSREAESQLDARGSQAASLVAAPMPSPFSSSQQQGSHNILDGIAALNLAHTYKYSPNRQTSSPSKPLIPSDQVAQQSCSEDTGQFPRSFASPTRSDMIPEVDPVRERSNSAGGAEVMTQLADSSLHLPPLWQGSNRTFQERAMPSGTMHDSAAGTTPPGRAMGTASSGCPSEGCTVLLGRVSSTELAASVQDEPAVQRSSSDLRQGRQQSSPLPSPSKVQRRTVDGSATKLPGPSPPENQRRFLSLRNFTGLSFGRSKSESTEGINRADLSRSQSGSSAGGQQPKPSPAKRAVR